MAHEKFQAEVLTPEGEAFNDEVEMVSTRTAVGSIGILASDVADSYRDRLRILAYQDYGQRCAFTPDSSETSKDKRNVRDGHYPIFGPLHRLLAMSMPSLSWTRRMVRRSLLAGL